MCESIFLWLAIVGVVIVIMTCIKDYSDKRYENTIKAFIISAGVFMFLASIMWRLKL